MLTPRISAAFRRDTKRARKRGKDMGKLRSMITLLLNEKVPPARCRDHPLKGPWDGYRDVHLEPDWLLIYRVEGAELLLARTGTHADLFNE